RPALWGTGRRKTPVYPATPGTFHHISDQHLDRYVAEFEGRNNIRDMDTIDQMAFLARGMVGKRIKYDDLVGKAGATTCRAASCPTGISRRTTGFRVGRDPKPPASPQDIPFPDCP
ncbi:MAG: hypothetical protein OXI01_07010, partial [Albidovulum sp.]|nr:hypothetical protein [Albidovulum sp.]